MAEKSAYNINENTIMSQGARTCLININLVFLFKLLIVSAFPAFKKIAMATRGNPTKSSTRSFSNWVFIRCETFSIMPM